MLCHESCGYEARQGLLCEFGFTSVDNAVNGDSSSDDPTFQLAWPVFSRIVLKHGRMVAPELEGRLRGFESAMLFRASRARIEELDGLLVSLACAGGDVLRWVSTVAGVEDALQFRRESRRFRRLNPLAEPDRVLRPSRWRCPNPRCNSLQPDVDPELLVVAPRMVGSGVSERVVQCAFCSHVLSMGEAVRLATEESWRHERLGVESV